LRTDPVAASADNAVIMSGSASSRSSTHAIGVGTSRSEPRSTEPETIRRSFARVSAT